MQLVKPTPAGRTGPHLAALSDGTLHVGLVYGHSHTAAFRYRPLLQRIRW